MEPVRLVQVAGGGTKGDGALATEAELREPFALDFDPSGNMYIAEMGGHRIRVVDRDGRISTLAGNGQPGSTGDGGTADRAQFNSLHDIRFHPDGDLYIADTFNARIRKIDLRTRTITNIVGTGVKGFSGDEGPADAAQVGDAYEIAFNSSGSHLFLADLDNFRVRMIEIESNLITTIAGNGSKGMPKDGGLALDEPLHSPRAVAVDSAGDLYIVERGGNAIHLVNRSGRINTIVGTGEPGYSGDEGPARQAKLRGPKHLIVDRNQNLIIVDTENHVIRKYIRDAGRIVHVAGTGVAGGGETQLKRPHGVCLDPQGNLYIADSDNHRVVRVAH